MDFSFTEEQTLLRNSVQRFIQDRYDFEARRRLVASEAGWSRDNWRQFAELGLLAAPFPEDFGGLGGSAVETMIILEEFGRGLVVEPYLPSVVLAGTALLHGGSVAQKEEMIPAIAAGESVFAFAYAEPQGRYDLFDVQTSARRVGKDFVLDGHKAVVLAAPWADRLILSARTGGGGRERDGITLFLVGRDARGLSLRTYPTIDGMRAAEVVLDGVRVGPDAVLGEIDGGLGLIERATDAGIAALCAEAIGSMKVLHEDTLEYTKTRRQFGQPLANFQVLQHRMVDMFMAYEQSVSMTYMVTLTLIEASDVAERLRAASAAKVQIGKAGRFIGQQAVQLHGGMGLTEELRVGHHFKRLTMIDVHFGDVDHHLKRYASLS